MYITIDLGATNTRVASSKDLRTFHKIQKFPSDKNFAQQKRKIEAAIQQVSESAPIKNICVGVPGIIDKNECILIKNPNYNALDGVKCGELINTQKFNTQIHVRNDAALAALGEAVFGAGKDFESVAYLTLSTGVGGAKVENKRLSTTQKMIEPGHQIIVKDGRPEPNNPAQRGTLEAYVSGTAFKQIYKQDPKDCRDTNVWSDYADKLATGLVNVVVMWNPDIIILGGGIGYGEFDFFEKPLLKKLREYTLFDMPTIRRSTLEDDAGLYGGLAFLNQVK